MWRYKYLSSDYNADSNTGDLNNLVQFKIKKNKQTMKSWSPAGLNLAVLCCSGFAWLL